MKRYLAYSIYLSLAFLLIALVELGGFAIPASIDYPFLAAAVVLVLAGFTVNGLSWSALLRQGGARVPLSVAYASLGLSVFGKYIPGKVWSIVGRSAYVSERTELRGAAVAAVLRSTARNRRSVHALVACTFLDAFLRSVSRRAVARRRPGTAP